MIKMGTAVKIKVNQNAMSTYDFIYKVTCLLIGLSAIYWGYRLFLKGYLQLQGALSAKNKIASLTLQRVTPGIFFSLFGTFIVCFTIFKGFSWTETRSDGTIVEGVHFMQQRDSIESLYKFVLDKYDSVSIVNSEQKLIIDSLISSQKMTTVEM